jgi:hypothetical protein
VGDNPAQLNTGKILIVSHSPLVELIDNPRNETLLTQVNQFMGMDLYRHYAVQSLNAIAGSDWVSHECSRIWGRRGGRPRHWRSYDGWRTTFRSDR